jgi:hypothetical protein
MGLGKKAESTVVRLWEMQNVVRWGQLSEKTGKNEML